MESEIESKLFGIGLDSVSKLSKDKIRAGETVRTIR